MARINQRSVYIEKDVAPLLTQFEAHYPLLPFSMIVNVALRRYFKDAQHGIDGNLQPLPRRKPAQLLS